MCEVVASVLVMIFMTHLGILEARYSQCRVTVRLSSQMESSGDSPCVILVCIRSLSQVEEKANSLVQAIKAHTVRVNDVSVIVLARIHQQLCPAHHSHNVITNFRIPVQSGP